MGADDSFDRATGVGGRNSFKVLYGGKIRLTKAVVSTTEFKEGNILEMNDSAQWAIAAGNTDRLQGVAIEKKVSGSHFDDLTIGSSSASAVIDEAVIETREIASGIVLAVNDLTYDDGTGHFTNASGSGKLNGRVIAGATGGASGSSGVAQLLWFGQNQTDS